MGYHVKPEISDACIPLSNLEMLFQRVKEIPDDTYFQWVYLDNLKEAAKNKDIHSLCRELRYACSVTGKPDSPDRCVEILYFLGKKLGNDYEIWKEILGPHLDKEFSPEIIFRGEDNNVWRYIWVNGEFKEQEGSLSWS